MTLALLWDRLRPIGFNAHVAQVLAARDDDDSRPARVIQAERNAALLDDGARQTQARLLPALPPPVTGDWVLARCDAHGTPWVTEVLPRFTHLQRRDGSGRPQALVANVDTALLLIGATGDFNPRRLERFVALVQPAGVQPVVVLTKIDLAADPSALHDTLRARLPRHLPILLLDARSPQAAQMLAPYLGAGQTLVLLGSSGAGKSTLTNSLLGGAVQSTGAVRAGDERGRHTTTARSLFVLPGGGCVIDTPGLRTLRPDGDLHTLNAGFDDIAALAQQCRFADCRHLSEPGCAVHAAVDSDRLANYGKLQREMQRDQMTPLDRRRLLAEWKVRHRAAKQRMAMKH
jgi:ribosome biogenesis GTPase